MQHLETCFLLFLTDIKYRNSNVRKRIKSHFDIFRLFFLKMSCCLRYGARERPNTKVLIGEILVGFFLFET